MFNLYTSVSRKERLQSIFNHVLRYVRLHPTDHPLQALIPAPLWEPLVKKSTAYTWDSELQAVLGHVGLRPYDMELIDDLIFSHALVAQFSTSKTTDFEREKRYAHMARSFGFEFKPASIH